ncbi:peptidase S8/S53 domain-containing protein [Trichoderma compactum]
MERPAPGLVDEIKRQIRILDSDTGENRGVEQKKKYLGIIDARQQNTDHQYRNALLALLANLTSDTNFCGDATVVDQKYAKGRGEALQGFRTLQDIYTADIWERRELRQWISGPEPSVIVVQGTPQSAERLETFGVESVDYLEARSPTAFLLSPLPAIFYENSISEGDDVLRQIAVQCLRIIDAFSWPARFSTDLRVMILTGRSIDGHLGATTRVISVDMAPRSPLRVHDLSKFEKASVLLPRSNKPEILVSLPASLNNTETTKQTFARNSTPSYLVNSSRKEERQHLIEGGHRSDLGRFQAADSGVISEGSPISWFKNLNSKTHPAIYSSSSAKANQSKPVKIAVLDTGFAYTEEHDKKTLKPYMHRIKKFSSFVEGETDLEAMKDPSGHGTAVAVQLLKLASAPKVGNRELFPDKEAVERAIKTAVEEPEKGGWSVDIITMSFGWAFDDHDGVRNAIRFARRRGVHMFASTSNDGLLGPPNDILYPSRAPEVIAIDAADGFGEYTRTTASSVSSCGRGRKFSAPGTRLTSPHSAALYDGSSFACAAAAGICALVLEFARQPPLQTSKTVQDRLKEMSAMIAILERMSAEKGPDRFKFLLPWTLLGKPGQPREFTAYCLVDELRNEFGLVVGSEVFPLGGEI